MQRILREARHEKLAGLALILVAPLVRFHDAVASAPGKLVPHGTRGSPRGGSTRGARRRPRRTPSNRPPRWLIKNQGKALYDHPALAEKFAVAPDANSATFTLRKGTKFHNGDPVTLQDVKFSYENYRGAKADVFKKKTERIEIVDDRTIRFVFKEPFLDFAILFGTANVAGPGGVVPEKYYKQVGRRPSSRSDGAGPSSSCATNPA